MAHGSGHDDHASGGHHEPHEMPWWPMNLPLVVLAIGSLAFGWWAGDLFGGSDWIGHMLHGSTQFAAVDSHGEHHAVGFWQDPHHIAMAISIVMAVGGIAVAGLLFWLKRDLVAKLRKPIAPLVNLLYHKYYVDEFYDVTVVKPLRAIAHLCYIFDSLVIDGLVLLFGWLPRLVGYTIRPTQSGKLQGYGVGMAFGLGTIVLLIFYATVYAK